MAKKNFSVQIAPDEVLHTSIHKSKDGYNSARIVAKRGEKEYMAVSYEWEGDYVPSFAMDLMGFMQANEVKESGMWPGKEEAYLEYAEDMEEDAQECPDGQRYCNKRKKCVPK